MVKIKNIPINDRPRERLFHFGGSSLNNEELLSIILGSGNKNKGVKDIASSILGSVKDICDLKNLNYQELIKIDGIGNAKACILLAVFELSKRMNQNIVSLNGIVFNSPDIIFEYFKDKFSLEMQENFYCVYLDSKKRIISSKLLFKGTVDRSLVHPREVFKEAYLLSASSIICVHNHPSGNINPSREDCFLTKMLKEVGEIMGIEVNDHIIVGKENYYSFFENGEI